MVATNISQDNSDRDSIINDIDMKMDFGNNGTDHHVFTDNSQDVNYNFNATFFIFFADQEAAQVFLDEIDWKMVPFNRTRRSNLDWHHFDVDMSHLFDIEPLAEQIYRDTVINMKGNLPNPFNVRTRRTTYDSTYNVRSSPNYAYLPDSTPSLEQYRSNGLVDLTLYDAYLRLLEHQESVMKILQQHIALPSTMSSAVVSATDRKRRDTDDWSQRVLEMMDRLLKKTEDVQNRLREENPEIIDDPKKQQARVWVTCGNSDRDTIFEPPFITPTHEDTILRMPLGAEDVIVRSIARRDADLQQQQRIAYSAVGIFLACACLILYKILVRRRNKSVKL